MEAKINHSETVHFQTIDQELNAYNSMTEKEVIEFYNVDSKKEALQYILDYWESENTEVFEEGYYLDFCYKNYN